MSLSTIRYETDNLLREVRPLDKSTDPPTTVTAGTCTGRLFNNKKDSYLTTSAGGGGNILVIRDTRPFVVGDTIYVKLDTGVWHNGGALVSKQGDTLTITTVLPTAASIYRRVSVKLGPNISMPIYGSPDITTDDWGYGGVIADNHADLRIGMSVRVETQIDAGVDVKLTKTWSAFVRGGT